MKITGKRELLAQGLRLSRAAWLASCLPPKDSLLVLAYHRIGDTGKTLFDPGVFSASEDHFYQQIAFLKKHLSVVTLDEALEYLEGKEKNRHPRCRALITFDDGYIDNYETAYPILCSLGVQGTFFLASGMVGTDKIPWWDTIAHVLRTASKSKFTLEAPQPIQIDLEHDGFAESLRRILQRYKSPENHDGERFICELAEACQGKPPSASSRLFLNWTEASEMLNHGMAVGSHTDSHTVLSQLSDELQLRELVDSRRILTEKLGTPIDTIAYPVGSRTAFTEKTQGLARQAGYRAAFSFYGGVNRLDQVAQFNNLREDVGSQSMERFRVQVAVCKGTGHFWP